MDRVWTNGQNRVELALGFLGFVGFGEELSVRVCVCVRACMVRVLSFERERTLLTPQAQKVMSRVRGCVNIVL